MSSTERETSKQWIGDLIDSAEAVTWQAVFEDATASDYYHVTIRVPSGVKRKIIK